MLEGLSLQTAEDQDCLRNVQLMFPLLFELEALNTNSRIQICITSHVATLSQAIF